MKYTLSEKGIRALRAMIDSLVDGTMSRTTHLGTVLYAFWDNDTGYPIARTSNEADQFMAIEDSSMTGADRSRALLQAQQKGLVEPER